MLKEVFIMSEKRRQFDKAYKLFELCGAKLETGRLKDKISPELLRSVKLVPKAQFDQGTALTFSSHFE